MASESQLQQRTLCILNVQERSFPDYYSGSPRTPWGKVHHQTEYDGANFGEVSTEHHGGMFVRGEWAKKIPHYLRKTWYEEDCEIKIVMYYLYDELKALQQQFADSARPYPLCSRLGSLERYSKAQMLDSMLYWHRAKIDFHKGVETARHEFSCDKEYTRYIHDLNHLKVKRAHRKSQPKLKLGDVVEFKNAYTFAFCDDRISIKRFRVTRWRKRGIGFIPLNCDRDFVAQLTRWRDANYTVITER